MFKLYKFKSRGIGVISTNLIPKNSVIGNYLENPSNHNTLVRHIYNGWFETPMFGRYINHNKNPNCDLILKSDRIEIISNKDILPNQEITVNYFDVVEMLEMPIDVVKRHQIANFNYIEEDIEKKTII